MPISIAALAGVEAAEAGLASGLIVAGAVVAGLGIVAALTLIRRDELEQAEHVEPALDLAALATNALRNADSRRAPHRSRRLIS